MEVVEVLVAFQVIACLIMVTVVSLIKLRANDQLKQLEIRSKK